MDIGRSSCDQIPGPSYRPNALPDTKPDVKNIRGPSLTVCVLDDGRWPTGARTELRKANVINNRLPLEHISFFLLLIITIIVAHQHKPLWHKY